jgi:hypothetical protein
MPPYLLLLRHFRFYSLQRHPLSLPSADIDVGSTFVTFLNLSIFDSCEKTVGVRLMFADFKDDKTPQKNMRK